MKITSYVHPFLKGTGATILPNVQVEKTRHRDYLTPFAPRAPFGKEAASIPKMCLTKYLSLQWCSRNFLSLRF